ncbi:MAG: hypothetical protein EOP86_00125 [Verrucomicrobiaceae bacterium]|nr:MAG: hypothetical protein EOP86_00125 [Verrucomicrobiaceae bacterium]
MATSPTAAVTASHQSPDSGAAGLRDFSDRLSPMLVKELRQGLRSPLFVWGLMVMHLALVLVVWMTVSSESSPPERLNRSFFLIYCGLVCGLLPLRAVNALHDELSGASTIDTLVLTRMSGWRITLGKWAAIAAQQVLVALTVLPYFIVRYFMGGVNVALELAWMGVFLLVGLASSAVLTGFSWLKFFLLRAVVMLGVTVAAGSFCVKSVKNLLRNADDNILIEAWREPGGWSLLALMLTAMLHGMFFALDLGAARVGILAENRATRRRLTGLLVLGIYTGLLGHALWSLNRIYAASSSWGPRHFITHAYSLGAELFELLVKLGLPLIGGTILLLMLQALLEKPVNLAPVLWPFVRKGRIGRLAGRLLYPGWPSGVIFSVTLLTGLVAARGVALWFDRESGHPFAAGLIPEFVNGNLRELNAMVCGPGILFLTLPIPLILYQCFFRRRADWHLGSYSLMLMVLLAPQMLLSSLAFAFERGALLKLGLPFPSMAPAWLGRMAPEDTGRIPLDVLLTLKNMPEPKLPPAYLHWSPQLILVLTVTTGIFWWIMALWLAVRAFRETSAAERELRLEMRKPEDVAAATPPDPA